MQGGIVPKTDGLLDCVYPWLLAIEDPAQPGRSISANSTKIQEVRWLFAWAASMLRLAVQQQSAQASDAAEQVQTLQIHHIHPATALCCASCFG